MSDDLGFDFTRAAPWFPHAKENPYVLVRVSDEHAKSWADALGLTVRRCYVSDSIITAKAQEHGVELAEIVAARLPDAGSTMAGDFGEILVYLYQCAKDVKSFGPKKWRLKQDRTKPAPHSDVLHFTLPTWPKASDEDVLICSEVKTKSTNGDSTPIQSAIEDSAKDRTSRLVRTLVWLRERALVESLGDVQIAHLDRFINATDHPEAKKQFRAVAVVCKSLVDDELRYAPRKAVAEYAVVVIAVPDLKKTYSAVFAAAHKAVSQLRPTKSSSPRALKEPTK
ncbi:MAG: DUF1837 domain-containing protein [Planctomycetes bacterium]|nr:DUF1837 domain-containing protein [Planctomycetota bacterium]